MFIRTMKGTLPAVDKPQNDHTTWWLDSAGSLHYATVHSPLPH